MGVRREYHPGRIYIEEIRFLTRTEGAPKGHLPHLRNRPMGSRKSTEYVLISRGEIAAGIRFRLARARKNSTTVSRLSDWRTYRWYL